MRKGKTRIAVSVALLGLASSATGAEPAEKKRAGAVAEVQFQPDGEGTSLLTLSQVMPVYNLGYYYGHGWWGPYAGFARSYQRVCRGPCSVRFAPGAYDLALEKDGRVARSESPVVVRQRSVVRGEYLDRSGVRTGGILIGVGGLVGGTIMMVAATDRHNVCTPYGCYYHDDVDGALLAGGIALAIGAAIAGSIMAWQRDEAVFTVLPLRVSALSPGERAGPSQALPQGAVIAARF